MSPSTQPRVVLLPWLILLCCWSGTGLADNQVLSIGQVDQVLYESDFPPPEDAPWLPVELIGAERIGVRSRDQRTWFRFELEKPDANVSELYSLYFWRYNMSLTVFMNGQELGGDRFKPGYQTMAWNHPLLVTIQASNWREGKNVFHVRFNPSTFGGTFADIKFAQNSVIQPIWEEMYTWKIRVGEYLLAFALLVVGCSLVLWMLRRQDKIYLWFAGIALSWSVLMTHMVIYFNPVPYQYWLPLVHAAVSCWIFFLFGFVNRLVSLGYVVVERLLLGVLILALLSHAFMPREYFWIAAYYFHLAMLCSLLVLFVGVLRKALSERDRIASLVVFAVAGQVALSGHDMWLFFLAESEDWETAMHFSQFGVPLMLAVFLVSLIQRFTSALNESERLNRELEHRVNETREALRQSFEENRQLELQQVASQEREKIYRDLHDDVGSRLLSIIHTAGDSSANLASSALDSLREAVYRSNYSDEPFLDFLADMREEAKLRASGQGFQCDWYEDPDLPNDLLEAKQCYHISRILREVISNTFTHSGGNQLSISVEPEEDSKQLVIEVTDNGDGNEDVGQTRGSGVRNIVERAGEIKGRVEWIKTDGGGTTFKLWFVPQLEVVGDAL